MYCLICLLMTGFEEFESQLMKHSYFFLTRQLLNHFLNRISKWYQKCGFCCLITHRQIHRNSLFDQLGFLICFNPHYRRKSPFSNFPLILHGWLFFFFFFPRNSTPPDNRITQRISVALHSPSNLLFVNWGYAVAISEMGVIWTWFLKCCSSRAANRLGPPLGV